MVLNLESKRAWVEKKTMETHIQHIRGGHWWSRTVSLSWWGLRKIFRYPNPANRLTQFKKKQTLHHQVYYFILFLMRHPQLLSSWELGPPTKQRLRTTVPEFVFLISQEVELEPHFLLINANTRPLLFTVLSNMASSTTDCAYDRVCDDRLTFCNLTQLSVK